MPVRPSVRFDVFKRDGFTCQYCGRKTPDVVLEIDHVHPLSKGGSSDIENLVTSCQDCNRGKRDGLLDERAPVLDVAAQTDLILEREAQLRAYHEAKELEIARKQRDYDACWNHWFELWEADNLPRYHCPWPNQLRFTIERIGIYEVMEAMDVAREKFDYLTTSAVKYYGGIVKRKLARAEGRIVPCRVCGKDVILERGDDPSLSWRHGSCRDA